MMHGAVTLTLCWVASGDLCARGSGAAGRALAQAACAAGGGALQRGPRVPAGAPTPLIVSIFCI